MCINNEHVCVSKCVYESVCMCIRGMYVHYG
jgi:hypothetical protein